MSATTSSPTLLLPDLGPDTPTTGLRSHGLPADLLRQATGRLRVMALLYAAIFFLAGLFPPLLFPGDRAMLFSTPMYWLPGVLSIAIALLVAAVIRNPRLSPLMLFVVCLTFEIVSSYGIAAAEFLTPLGMDISPIWNGLSWVAVWVLMFSIVIPSTPGRSVLAGLASITSVPVVVAISLSAYPPAEMPPGGPAPFFFTFIFPYLLVVAMAYVGARAVYALGNEVRKARELGSYRLLERIGKGGMGEVWRARHHLLARPAAVKIIRPTSSSPAAVDAARRRFEREAQAIASLRSPHTIDLFDFGIADDGTFYYVMELLDGLNAEQMVQRFGPLSAERVIHVIRQVCHSLSEAESVGLVHRDIKPANVILCRYGQDFDFVKVLDFGIVKAIHGSGEVDSRPTEMMLTVEHLVQGTPAFIAPEQAMGGTEVDGRADIYATGGLAYWLLTGQLVFAADTPMGLILHHAQTPPERPSTRTEMPIPPELEDVVMECLAKNPADRPQTARELLRRLDEVPLRNAWTAERARDWWALHQPA